MVTTTPVHPEGPRYGAPIVYVPGVWLGPQVWQPAASYLGHRGWAGMLVDARAVPGGIDARAAAVSAHLAALPAAPVLIGHDAGALVALAMATRMDVRAMVLLAPLCPGAPATHALTWSGGLVWSLLRRRPVAPPAGPVGDAFFADLPAALRRTIGNEDPRLLAQLARRSAIVRPVRMPPTLVLHGGADPILPRDEALRFARDVGAESLELPGRGHWLLAAGAWQDCGDRVHRWLVQRLGETILELYAEAMADREDDGDE